MRIFGIEFSRARKALNAVPQSRGGWHVIHEPFTGAWQRNREERIGDITSYPTLYACLSRISQDIGKLPFVLKAVDSDRVWSEVQNPAYSPVLRKPNHYQTAQQFRESWILSKLTNGNAYILKQRDNRNVVTALYVLDPCRVLPLVADDGAVFYQLFCDNLNEVPELKGTITVPASEVIHDRCMPVHHPLVGVPPLCAANWPAVKNLRILRSSSEFFGNRAMPGGILTGPASIKEETAKKLSEQFNEGYTGKNAGRIAVIGADLKFTAFAVSSADSQLVEQLRYSDEQICQPFGIPPFKVGIGSIPAGLGVDAVNLLYFEDALQAHIEAMENLLDEALSLPSDLGIWMDTEPLLRMDVSKQAEVVTKLIGGKTITPDEGRFRLGYGPTAGGNTIWGQHQDYPLGVLAARNDLNDASGQSESVSDESEEVKKLRAELWQAKALNTTREALR